MGWRDSLGTEGEGWEASMKYDGLMLPGIRVNQADVAIVGSLNAMHG